MLHNVALAEDEPQFEEICCRRVKVSLQVALAGISKMCMIMELRYLHTSLHLSLSLSLSLDTPQHTHTHSSLPLSFYSSLDLSTPCPPSLSHWLWTVIETACDPNPSPVLFTYINATYCWSPEPYF